MPDVGEVVPPIVIGALVVGSLLYFFPGIVFLFTAFLIAGVFLLIVGILDWLQAFGILWLDAFWFGAVGLAMMFIASIGLYGGLFSIA